MTDESKVSESVDKFVWAVKNGELKDVQLYLKNEAHLLNEQIQGRSPLHYAADYGQAEVIGFLADQGGDVNANDNYGITPLLSAIYEGHKACVEVLIAKGASKCGKAPGGETYIECAESQEIKNLLQ